MLGSASGHVNTVIATLCCASAQLIAFICFYISILFLSNCAILTSIACYLHFTSEVANQLEDVIILSLQVYKLICLLHGAHYGSGIEVVCWFCHTDSLPRVAPNTPQL